MYVVIKIVLKELKMPYFYPIKPPAVTSCLFLKRALSSDDRKLISAKNILLIFRKSPRHTTQHLNTRTSDGRILGTSPTPSSGVAMEHGVDETRRMRSRTGLMTSTCGGGMERAWRTDGTTQTERY